MPDLDPATKEVWAGLREVTSRKSEIREEVEQLRDNLSGYPSYTAFLDGQADFDALESDLLSRYSDVGEVTNADVSRTVDDLRNNFADHATYESGADSETTYDGYRTYLINNGLTSVEADRHIQLLKLTFDPGATFKDDATSFASFSDFETYLSNNGSTASEATNFRNKVEQRFADFSEFDTEILSDDTPLQRLLAWAAQVTEAGGPDSPTALRLWDIASIALDGTSIPEGALTLRGADVLNEIAGIPDSPTDESSAVSYSGISLDSTTIQATGSTTVSATLSNTTSEFVSDLTVPLVVDGNVRTRKTLSLSPSQSVTVAFDVGGGTDVPLTVGQHQLRIGDSGTVTLTVEFTL